MRQRFLTNRVKIDEMVIMTDLKFTVPFSISYLRNNRSSGQKSLRCFPHCTEKGHIASGFCGDHLEATATIKKDAKFGTDWLDRITVVGEIRPFSDQGISSGKKVSRRKLIKELRDITGGTKTGGELQLGVMKVLHEDDHIAKVSISFNADKHSWDYSWKSNRWSGVNNSHVVDVVLVESHTYMRDNSADCDDDDDLEVFSSACGDTFLILSSHKSPHLKRKLSAAAAAEEGGIQTESETNDKPLPVANLDSLVTQRPKRRNPTAASDPMSALLMALGDGSHGLASNDHLPSDPYSCSSGTNEFKFSPTLVICPLSTTWGESIDLPTKRRRKKSMKMIEYSEGAFEEKDDSSTVESTQLLNQLKSIREVSEHGDCESMNSNSNSSALLGAHTDCDDISCSSRNDAHDDAGGEGEGGGGGGGVDDGDEEFYHEDGLRSAEFEFHGDDTDGASAISRRKAVLKRLKPQPPDEYYQNSDVNAIPLHVSGKYNISKEDLHNADSKIFDLRWNETFAELVTYCETFGHGNVPKDYKSVGGRWLGKWLDFQRQMKKKNRLRADRIARLEELVSNGYLNMYDGPRRGHRLSGENVHQWEGWYSALLEYGETNGNYNVPRHYVIPPTTTSTSAVLLFNTVGRKLGRWLQTQRLRSRSGDLRGDRLKRLQELADTGKLDWLGKENSTMTEKERGDGDFVPISAEEDEGDDSVLSSDVSPLIPPLSSSSSSSSIASASATVPSASITSTTSSSSSSSSSSSFSASHSSTSLDSISLAPPGNDIIELVSTCEILSKNRIDISAEHVVIQGSFFARTRCQPSQPNICELKKTNPVQASNTKHGITSSSSSIVRTCSEVSTRSNAVGSVSGTGTGTVTGTEILGQGVPRPSEFFELDDASVASDLQTALNLNGMEALLFAATSH